MEEGRRDGGKREKEEMKVTVGFCHEFFPMLKKKKPKCYNSPSFSKKKGGEGLWGLFLLFSVVDKNQGGKGLWTEESLLLLLAKFNSQR